MRLHFVLTREENVLYFQKFFCMKNQLGISTQWLKGDEVRKLAMPCSFEDVLTGLRSVVSTYIKAAG